MSANCKTFAAALLGFLVLSLGSAASAQSPPPNLVHFQARLANAASVPISGPVSLQIAVYDVPIGGAPLWSESQSTTALNGVVNLLLGTYAALPANLFIDGNRYLGLTIGGDSEMAPRLQLASVPFAARAGQVAAIDSNTSIGAGLINSTHIQDNSIATVDLADGAVTSSKLAAGAVGSSTIADGAIATNHISSAAVTQDKIAAGAVDNTRIADGSVSSNKLAIGAVTGAVIQVGSIDGSALSSLTITNDKIGPNAVDSSKLADGSVGTSKLVDGSVSTNKLIDGSVTTNKLIDGSVSTNKLADGSVSASKLTAGAVTSATILDGSILAADISPLSITGDRLAPNSIDSTKIVDGSVTATKIAAGAVATAALADGAVGPTKLSSPLIGPGATIPIVSVEATSSFATAALRGVASSATGATTGIDGQSFSSTGTAVRGAALALSGINFGVVGQSASSSGYGLYGTALSGTGGVGVFGSTNSTQASAMAIQGVVNSTSPGNLSAAVRGDNKGTGSLGVGVWGNHAGNGFGVYGTVIGGVGVLGFANGASGTNYGVYGQSASATGYGLYSAGNSATTGTKSFIQPDPNDASKELHFVCLEGNESGTYFRGSSKLVAGVATITVPAEFRAVTEEEGLTVQVTPVGGRASLWIESQDLGKIVVNGDADVAFHYFVNGVRRGFAGHQVVRPNQAFVPELRGVPFGTQFPEAFRKILVASGILNADYTPNEDTAVRMGWKLRDPLPEDPQVPVAPAKAVNGSR